LFSLIEGSEETLIESGDLSKSEFEAWWKPLERALVAPACKGSPSTLLRAGFDCVAASLREPATSLRMTDAK